MKNTALLLVIVLLAAIIRLWQLDSNPPGLTWDEAALGYNGYSILQTGRDEYGNLLPLNLKSFGDYKPAIYAYLTIPLIAVLGLSEWAVRLPSALFGILAVYGIFLLINQLFKNRWVALSCALMLAISPWAIQFSRAAFEANVALTLNIFGAYFLVKAKNKTNWLVPAAFVFGLSLLTYLSSKLFVPLFVIGLVLLFYRRIKSSKPLSLGILAFLGVLGIVFVSTFVTGKTDRLATQNFFAYQRPLENTQLISSEDTTDSSSVVFQILHGQWWDYYRGLFEHYFIYFSPKILFIEGDYSQRHRVPDLGVLFYFSVILIPIGLLFLLRQKGSAWPIFIWLILAPIPAVLSRDLISILRALNMVVPLAILEGTGLYVLLRVIWGIKGYWKYLGLLILSITIGFNFFIYLDRLFVHSPIQYSMYWLYGYKETLSNLKADQYQNVVVTDVYGQPYIYYLFYNQYPPIKYQQQAKLDQPTVDVGTVRKIDNIEFRHIFWPHDRGTKNSLFIGSLDELPDKDILPFSEFRVLKDVRFLDGEPALRVVETPL